MAGDRQRDVLRGMTRFNQLLLSRVGPQSRLFRLLARTGWTPGWLMVERLRVGDRPAEWLRPRGRLGRGTILYFHGGGWVVGYYPMNRRLAGGLGRAAGMRTLALRYRLAPAHPYPAALEDCLTAYRWLLAGGTPAAEIVVAGDSAGGNLLLALLLRLRDERLPQPAGGICFSPVTDLTGRGPSFWRQDDVGLSPQLLLDMAAMYVGAADPRQPLISPAFADLTGLPPLLLQIGEAEILFSDTLAFTARAQAANVAIQLQVWPTMWHAWHILAPMLPEASAALNAAGEFARSLVTGPASPWE